jgi:hypothetical protein
MDESVAQPNRVDRRLTDGPPFRVAHITGMVAHITGMPQRNEMTETRRWRRDDAGFSLLSLTHVGHLRHHNLTLRLALPSLAHYSPESVAHFTGIHIRGSRQETLLMLTVFCVFGPGICEERSSLLVTDVAAVQVSEVATWNEETSPKVRGVQPLVPDRT